MAEDGAYAGTLAVILLLALTLDAVLSWVDWQDHGYLAIAIIGVIAAGEVAFTWLMWSKRDG